MPTWKFHKGESKTFEGTVLIATVAGGDKVNYDISAATLGFDLGTVLDQWMIRTNTLYGSVGTNNVFNPSFTQGTFGWLDTLSGNTISTLSGPFTFPYNTVLTATTNVGTDWSIEDVGTATKQTTRGTYLWSFDFALLTGNFATVIDLEVSDMLIPLGSKVADFNWHHFIGTGIIGTSVKTGPLMNFQSGQLNKICMLTNVSLQRVAAPNRFQIMTGSMGVYRFSFLPEDTENLTATSYYFDIWMRDAGKEYTLTVGTLQLLPVVGTM